MSALPAVTRSDGRDTDDLGKSYLYHLCPVLCATDDAVTARFPKTKFSAYDKGNEVCHLKYYHKKEPTPEVNFTEWLVPLCVLMTCGMLRGGVVYL